MSRIIPGLKAEIIDFQIQSAPITNPGEIVVLLCDLPDQVTIADPDNIGEVITLSVPANVPLLINGTTALKELILGSELVTGLNTLVGADRHLDIVNVLPMLNSDLPLAVCKIVRRNGERPDTSIKKEIYEALEVAYENLENYPAGFIVPLGVSIEDVVVTAQKASVNKVKTFEATASFNNSVFTEAKATALSEPGKESIVAGLKVELDMVVNGLNATPKVTVKDNANVVILTETLNESLSLVCSETNSLRTKYAELNKLAKPNGTLVAAPVSIVDDTLIPLVQEGTIEAKIAEAKAERGLLIVTPLTFVNGNVKKVINKDILIGGVKVASLVIEYTLKASEAITFSNGSYTVNWASLTDDVVVKKINETSIAPSTWYIGGTEFAFKTVANATITAPVAYSATPGIERTLTAVTTKNNFKELTSALEVVELERNAFTVEKYIKATETRNSEEVLIDFDANTNACSVSALLSLDNTVEKNGGVFIEINEVEVELEGVEIAKIGSKMFVAKNYDFNYNDAIKIKFLAGLELPQASTPFSIEITIVPAGAAFDKRAVDFCDYLTKQMNDCRVVLGVKPAKTTSSEDIKDQVTRISKNIGAKSYVKGNLDAGAYLTVVAGAHKVNGCGGITNFPETKIISYDAIKKSINVDASLTFVKGDKVDLITVKKGRFIVDENIVEDIIPTVTGFELILKEELSPTFLNGAITSAKRIQISNAKDRSGSFLAALYAVTANNYGIDKDPFNYVLPGSSEILYSANQLKQITNAGITTVTRNTFDTRGYVFDTPTKAGETSDFQDQGSFGLVLYFIRQLRNIAGPKKGQRFGSAEKQMILKTELEAPFQAQKGITIVDYRLNVDFSKLNSANELSVSFEVREAKKLKVIKISAKLF